MKSDKDSKKELFDRLMREEQITDVDKMTAAAYALLKAFYDFGIDRGIQKDIAYLTAAKSVCDIITGGNRNNG